MGSARAKPDRARHPAPASATDSAKAAAKPARRKPVRSGPPVPSELRPYFDSSRVPDKQTLLAILSQRITEPTGIPFLATDRLGRIMMWSEGATQVFGIDASKAVGKLTLADIWPHRKGEITWEQALDRALHGKIDWVGSVTIARPDGAAPLVRLHVSAVSLHPGGGVKGFIIGGKDVTEEERHRRQIEADQIRLHALLDADPAPWVAVDLAGAIADLNEAMTSLCGRPKEELLGTEFTDCFAVADRDRARDVIRQALRDEPVAGYELRLGDDEGRAVHVAARILRDAERRPLGLVAALTDVSESQRRDRRLKEAQSFTEAVRDTADGVVIVDRNSRITDVSDQMCALIGLSRAELVGAKWGDIIANAGESRRLVDMSGTEGVLRDVVTELPMADGTTRHLSLNSGQFTTADGETRIFVMVRDVTKQVTQQEATARGQAYNRGLIEAAVDGLMTVDFSGFVSDVNSRLCEMLGKDRDQVVGSEFTRCFTEIGRAHELVHRALVAGEVVNHEMRLAGDRETTVSVNASVFRDDSGKIAGVFASLRDVTESKSPEEMQQHMLDQARKLDEAKTEFVSRVSHELRSPLTGILGYLELLHAGRPGKLNPEQERVVGIIERGGKRLLALIEDLLLLSRIEAGSLRMVISVVELEPLIRDVYETFDTATTQAQLNCRLDLEPGIVLEGDSGQLERLVANLLSNAVKFTQPGGHIVITTRGDGDDVIIEVTDDGIGIPADEQDRLFSRFFRSSISSKMEARGTGLGLFIVKQVAQGHGGTVAARSAPGEGSTFTVRIPRRQPEHGASDQGKAG